MRIDVWSDVVCPWCYIGKTRLEQAIAGFEHGDDVEVVYHSFQLDPSTPTGAGTLTIDALGKRFGGPEKVAAMFDHVEATAAADGLVLSLHQSISANTTDAHRLLHLAQAEGGAELQARLKDALLAAHFTHGEVVDDHAVLARIAGEVGLPADRVAQVLAGAEFADAVEADIRQAAAYGATGVPFFVVDGKYGISGAQPTETFARVLTQAWDEKNPRVQMVTDTPDGACGPDGCAM